MREQINDCHAQPLGDVGKKQESAWKRYKRLVSGQQTGWTRFVLEEIALSLLPPIPGVIGFGIRGLFYRLMLGRLGPKSIIDSSVTLRCPSNLSVGAGVIIESYAHLLCNSNHSPSIILGDKVSIRSYSILSAGPPHGFIHIGDSSTVAHHCILHGHGGLTIGRNVMMAGNCYLVASMHNYDNTEIPMSEQGFVAKGITIEDDVWLGAGVKVLDGVGIGKGSIVGAGSVVTRDLPSFTVAYGAPARVQRRRK